MEELINKLDNWALFKLFGGIGVILSAFIIHLSKIINQRMVHKWQEKSNKELAELKGTINKNNSIVTTLAQQYGQNFQKLLDKRIEATEIFWDGILKMKSSIPSVIHVSYQIFLDEELTVESLNKTKSGFGQEIRRISQENFASELSSISDNITRYRPFISEQLWILMFAYQAFIGRSVYLIINGYQKNEIKIWKKDSRIKQIVSTVLTEKELGYIFNLQVPAYDSMLQILENKIMHELKRLISNEDLTMNSLTEIEKINKIMEQRENT